MCEHIYFKSETFKKKKKKRIRFIENNCFSSCIILFSSRKIQYTQNKSCKFII